MLCLCHLTQISCKNHTRLVSMISFIFFLHSFYFLQNLLVFCVHLILYFVQYQIGGPFHITYLSASKTIFPPCAVVSASLRHAHAHLMRHANCPYVRTTHIYADTQRIIFANGWWIYEPHNFCQFCNEQSIMRPLPSFSDFCEDSRSSSVRSECHLWKTQELYNRWWHRLSTGCSWTCWFRKVGYTGPHSKCGLYHGGTG